MSIVKCPASAVMVVVLTNDPLPNMLRVQISIIVNCHQARSQSSDMQRPLYMGLNASIHRWIWKRSGLRLRGWIPLPSCAVEQTLSILPDSKASFASAAARSQISYLPYMAIKSRAPGPSISNWARAEELVCADETIRFEG